MLPPFFRFCSGSISTLPDLYFIRLAVFRMVSFLIPAILFEHLEITLQYGVSGPAEEVHLRHNLSKTRQAPLATSQVDAMLCRDVKLLVPVTTNRNDTHE